MTMMEIMEYLNNKTETIRKQKWSRLIIWKRSVTIKSEGVICKNDKAIRNNNH